MDNCQFKKCERMVSLRLIDMLFNGGSSHSMAAFPLRAVYVLADRRLGDAPVQLLISVPKKRFHHAVDRNRVKRQLRESYRLHKDILVPSLPDGKRLLMSFVWLSDRHLPTAEVEQRVVNLLQRIAEKL
ncbi:MAG: ribonuclease P protein component [Prevotella sp.]|nr:ribonuclease P protein component [Prevotella sp.]MBQ8065069.1 ribonuclease P protein component [Prevotella sp.]MBR1505098.1 ribonuclease P protein component [Prevotella sp.]